MHEENLLLRGMEYASARRKNVFPLKKTGKSEEEDMFILQLGFNWDGI